MEVLSYRPPGVLQAGLRGVLSRSHREKARRIALRDNLTVCVRERRGLLRDGALLLAAAVAAAATAAAAAAESIDLRRQIDK